MIVNENEINKILEESMSAKEVEIDEIIDKSLEGKGLDIYETAVLLNTSDPNIIDKIYNAAKVIKEKIYGKRIVLFAPLYLTNKCVNNCLYCGFRSENKSLTRKTLNINEIIEEAKALEKQGQKRLLLVAGEHPIDSNVDFVVEAITSIYDNSDMRRLNINAAPMEVNDFRKLKLAGIGTYQCFQETYHRDTYKIVHPKGLKSDYDYRITVMDRAMEAGIDDIGMGVLYGLYDYKFDTLALLQHAKYLESKYNCGPHTISVPRLRPAPGSAITEVQYPLEDEDFKKLIAIIRLAMPYTGIILSTRESRELRDELLNLGVSQLSAGSSTSPGGYKEDKKGDEDQFYTNDNRTLDEVVDSICKSGYVPSFCTACYRLGRTGEDFMYLVKEGKMKNICRVNALMTLQEHLVDYSSFETKEKGEKIIKELLEEIDDELLKAEVLKRIDEIKDGKRDLFF